MAKFANQNSPHTKATATSIIATFANSSKNFRTLDSLRLHGLKHLVDMINSFNAVHDAMAIGGRLQ
jgi:hypothetical protein